MVTLQWENPMNSTSDQGLHHKSVDIMCGTSPWCQTLEELCILSVVSCPKSIDQEEITDRSRFMISLQNETPVFLKNCQTPERQGETENTEKDWVSSYLWDSLQSVNGVCRLTVVLYQCWFTDLKDYTVIM